ncbi:MAG: glucosaminidase domain-containing protein [Selenomonadaceae bacterium]|nr:glucosaminidase domain-containing protein [Selenomonadaceae bacterium]
MIPLSKITGKHSSSTQTKYNRRIPLSQIIGTTSPQAEPEETGGGFWDTTKNLFNFTPAGVAYNVIDSPVPYFAGGLLAETAGNVAERLGEEFPENSWRRRALDTASDFAQNITDAALKNAQNKVDVGDDDTFTGAIGNRFVSSASGLLGNAASMIHADKTADAAIETSESTANKNRVSTDDLGEYFTNPRGFASDATEQLTSTAMIAPFMALLPEAVAARGLAAFGGDAITQGLINRGLYGAAKWFAGGAPRAVQYGLTSAPVEGAMEGGETRRELLNQGASEEEATKESLITMGKNVPLLLATNTLEGLAFFSPLKGANKALQIAGRAAVNSAQEQYEEFAQQGIQNAALGEPYSWLPWNGAPNQYEAAERVRYPALLIGGFGGAVQALGGRNENQENYERGSQENISNENYSARANLTAKQAEIWDAAQYASARAKEKFGYDIPPELIYKQWAHEAGANFDSENARYNNNFGGLTQTEPNGEENKQPDGNNYYRHFNNAKDYADAYVDDFIKYYPEISGVKNEREFASVLKNYGYFGDSVENYAAGMEGISAPSSRANGNQPNIDFASGLQSARTSLDGKQMDNGTVGCVEAVTKILSHVHPEFKKMVDDGVVNTVEGENSLHSRLEKMGVEIIPFDESQVAQGDIIFYDGKQTYQHVLVADHKDADGNWRVFGNSSSANKVMEQPLYQGQTPSWIAKVSNLQGDNSSQGQIQQPPQQQEQTKPLFDINTEDSTTQKLLDKFANERFNEAINNEDEDGIKFFDGMFDDKDAFQSTPENRNAVIERYGEELSKFIQDNSAPETQTQSTTQPATNTSNVVQTENPYQRNAAIKSTANNFLEQLRAEGDQNKGATLFKLQNALNKGNFAEVENILKQNNVAIPQPQQAQPAPIQQNPVKENKPPENILTQPANTSGNEKLIKQASKIITKRTSHEGKKKIGNAILRLANQSGISVPAVDFKSLQNGSSKKIAEWQAKLSQAGAFAISPPQTSTSNKTSANEAVESKTAEGTTVFTPQSVIQAEEQKKNSLKYRAQQVLDKLSAQHTQNVLREREADLSNDETGEAVPFDYSHYVNDDETPTPAELQRQENEKVVQKYQAQQEKKRQERAEFDAAVKKDSENNYGLRADDARRRRERYEATRVDPITARGNAISDAREDEETLRDAERRENEEAQQVSPETLRENYARAQYLGNFDTNERLETMREEGRKQRDLEIEQLKTANRDARKAAGKEVLRTLRNPKYNTVKSKVDATSGLSTALENGSVEAIRQVRNLIAEVDNQELQEQQRNGTQAQIKPQVQPTPVQQPSEVRAPESVPQDNEQTPSGGINLESQTKEKSKGKWHTVGSADSREDLQQSIREHYHNDNLVIEDDGTVVDYETGEILSNVVRNNKGHWQFGKYENEQSKQSPAPQQFQKIQPVQKNNRYGNTAEVITGSRTPHQVKYKVVEANELNSSHVIDNGGVFANKNYPSELQPRNRERANMQAQLISMSNNLNPADLMDARDVNQGAPVVRKDGVVLNGNGRTAAIRYAYENGKGENYKNALIKNANRFGLNLDEISKMNQPVLVRELANDLTSEDLQDITTTQTGGARLGASEQAQSDAQKISSNTLALFPQNDSVDFTKAESTDFLRAALNDIATPDQRNSLTTSDGKINQDGINRVKRTLFALAYGDEGLISRMSESTDDNVRGVTNSLLNAAPTIAKVQAGMKNGTLHKYDLSAISDAVKKLSALRDQNKPVANYLQEQSLFGEDSAEMKEILSALDRYKRAPNKIAAFLKKTASNIQEQGDPRQGSLFGESEPAPLIDLIKQARQEVENNGQTMPMFSLNGEVDTTIDNFVDDKDLTPQQKLQQDFGNKLGAQTVFFNNENGDFHGAHANGTSYINVNSKMPIGKVFWHEASHWLKSNNAKLYDELAKAAGITDAQRDAYLKETGRTDLVTDEEIDEEIIADLFEDVAKRSGLLQSIAGKNRGLIQRVVQWLKDTMNKFIDHFRNPSGKLTTKQSIALADEFGRIAKDLVDPNGQKIFRYNNRTKNIELAKKNIELANGRSLDSLQDDEETKYSFAGRKAKTADKESLKRAKQMDERGANRDQIYRDTGWVKGKDNKWRFEIPDNLDKINFGKLARDGKATLGEIYFNPKLYAAYPQLKNMHVTTSDKITGAGQFNPSTNTITLYKDLVNVWTDRAKQALVHELQHVIQKIEGFAFGIGKSNPNYKNSGGEQEAREAAARAIKSNYKTTPIIHDENAVIIFNGKKHAVKVKRETPKQIAYSIDSDNSNESLTEKIKNKLSWFSGDKKTIRRKKVITAKLRELSWYRILYGNVKGANDIVVDHLQKLIQSRNTYDWNKLLPVVSKEIAKNLKLNPTAEQSNLIADWLLTGALNNTSAEMKAFQKAMRDNPAMADILLETRNLFQEIADMPADEQISSSLVDMRSKPFFEGDFTEEVLDDLSPLQKIVDTAIKNSSPEVAELIKHNVNPKQLAQLSRGSGAIADIMVNGKASELEKIRAMLSEKYTGVYFDKFKPINAIIKSVGGDWKGLQTYAVAKLSKEMYEYNRAHPELKEPLIPYTTEAAADVTIEQGEAKFGEAQKDLVIYSKVLLAMEHDSGLITDNTFSRVLNSWKNYVPMAQVFDENEDYTKLDYLKRRKGHEGDTWSPIQIMIANTHRRIQACERNKVKLELANLVRFGGFDSNLSEVASSNPDADNIIRFRENGKIKYLETPDPAIKRAVDSLQSKSDGTWIAKMLRAITGFMRMRLTGGNLDFAAGNIFRDLPDAYIHNNQLGKDVFIIGDFMRAWSSAVKELIQDARGKGMSQDLIDWKMSGGAQASFVSGDVDYIQRSIDEATSTRLQRYRRKPFMQLLDDMQKISEFTESVTRLTTYKLAKGKLAKGRAATITDKQLAALAAREASVDFAKAGRSTRKVNQIVLFANAAVQSLNLWIEAGKEFRKGNSKPLFGKLFRAAAHGVLMAALQAAIAHAGDDDDKEAYEQAPNWEKETYWIFPAIKNPITGTALRIPKGFDFGMRFMANLTDETIGAAFDNKPFEGKRFWETFKGALPSLTATIISPAIEAYTNYSFFRDAPIVPLREQHLDAEAQYDANTSSVAKAFGQMTGWSPRKIDYMINGYLGFMGRFLTNPSTDPDKFPMVRRFVFEPHKNPKIVKEYYEAYEEQTSHYNTYKQTKEKPDDFDPALYKRLKAANETMRKISNRERAIQNDENLSYSERRAKLMELEKKRVALCEKVFNKAR